MFAWGSSKQRANSNGPEFRPGPGIERAHQSLASPAGAANTRVEAIARETLKKACKFDSYRCEIMIQLLGLIRNARKIPLIVVVINEDIKKNTMKQGKAHIYAYAQKPT